MSKPRIEGLSAINDVLRSLPRATGKATLTRFGKKRLEPMRDSAKANAPVPVPRSSRRPASLFWQRLSASSTKHSVSGRGINVCALTRKGRDQNSRYPRICATGSPVRRR